MVRTAVPTWYRRLADIPGIGYAGDPTLAARLPERLATPKVQRFEELPSSLWWTTRDGSGSSSPAREFGHTASDPETTQELRVRVLTALELPGEPMDYHFILQNAGEHLWKRRVEQPQDLALAEWFWWLDVRLIEAHPEMVRISPDKDEFLTVYAFERIVGVYLREGHIEDALAASERFARFRPRHDMSELRARVERQQSEHA